MAACTFCPVGRHSRAPSLLETPWDRKQVPDTTAALLRLSFRCSECDSLIVPEGVVSRITVRSSPETPFSPLEAATCDERRLRAATEAVYADALPALARVRRMPEKNDLVAAQLSATNRFLGFDPSPHDLLCDGCGLHVGYVLERGDEPGLPADRPNEAGRAYKFYYWTPSRGSVLCMDDDALHAWAAMAPLIPPPLPAARERRGQLEMARELAATLGISVEGVPAVFQSQGTLRSLRLDEHHKEGLMARCPTATNSPLEHVMKGSASSRFVSVSSSPSIACLWALPFGSIVAVNEHVASRLGAEHIPIDELELLVTTEHVDSPVAVLRVRQAKEALFVGTVHGLAVERLVSRIARVCRPPEDIRAVGDGSDGFPTDAAISTLRVGEFPGSLSPSPDMGASLVSDACTGSQYVLFRVSRNSLPPHVAGDTDATFPHATDAARTQLAGACRAYRAEGGDPPLAYFEVDVEVFQFDRRVTSLDTFSIPRLPFLLLRLEGPAETISACVKRVYHLKKGTDELASSAKRQPPAP